MTHVDASDGPGDLAARVAELNATTEALDPPSSLESLFPDGFMAEYTTHDTFRGFLAGSPWAIESRADFDNIPEAKFDRYVERETAFETWQAFFDAASQHWFRTQLDG